MDKEKIKSELHKLIDEIDNEVVLENFLEAIADFHSRKSDIMDELSVAQKNRLAESLEQARTGKTVSHAAMKTAINQWLTK